MSNISMEVNIRKGRQLIFQLAFGGLIGGLAGYFGLGALDAETMAADQVILSGVGLIYLLMGLVVGFGLVAPKLGSNILNVEDAEEIRDQRRILTGSSICMVTLGVALIALPIADPGSQMSSFVGFGGLLAALTILIVISIRDWKYYDEMMLQLCRDAGNLAFGGIGGVLLIWASAAWVELVSAPTPLELVAIISGGYLLAIFVASARRGLLRQR